MCFQCQFATPRQGGLSVSFNPTINQSIKIGDDVEITVIEVRGDQVRLGVSAPRDVSVHRKEIYLQIQQETAPPPPRPTPPAWTCSATRLPSRAKLNSIPQRNARSITERAFLFAG